MNIEKQVEWLKPDRIMKLYEGKKTAFGTKRMFAIGVGRNGIDCLMRCKHLAENRYNTDKSRLRFLAVGEDKLLDAAEFCGSVLSADERLDIVPDEAIYKYLNVPERLPEQALAWFDTGLKNYTPAKPAYGMQKRQCGRVALFHYFDDLLKILGDAISAFSKNTAPLDIVVMGNMGDAFFGGMAIDLGYVLRALFETADYPVKVIAYMFAGDTAKFYEKDGRDLANSYANTIVTKGELDKFQCRKEPFSQKYTASFEISSDKPPFSACYITSAEDTYEHTLEAAALKIFSEPEIVYARDDDADKIMSYNMLGKTGAHSFRYLAYSSAASEVPIGQIVSYLNIKLLMAFNRVLNGNRADPMEVGKLIGKVTPNAMLLASRAGDIPKLEFDEKLNPLFSVRSLKNGSEASKKYVNEKVEQFADLCRKGARIMAPEIVDSVISVCDGAKNDFEKGPFYAVEIVKKCLAELRVALAKVKDEMSDIDENIAREERMLETSYKKVRSSPGIFAGRSAEDYCSWLKEYAEYKKIQLTCDTLKKFYEEVYGKLENYYKEDLYKKAEIFEKISIGKEDILFGSSPYEGFGVSKPFDISSPEIRAKLDKMVDELPESTQMMAFKRCELLNSPGNDEMFLPREIANIAKLCFTAFLEQNYDDLCAFFGTDATIAKSLEELFGQASVKTPADDDLPLTRVICPKSSPAGELAPIRAVHKGINCLWNDSAARCTVSVVQIKGGVRLDGFKDYTQWENMRYAYVNDSLKKHGIHIFR